MIRSWHVLLIDVDDNAWGRADGRVTVDLLDNHGNRLYSLIINPIQYADAAAAVLFVLEQARKHGWRG